MNKCVYALILVMFVIGCKETQVRQSDFAPFKKPVTLSTTTEAVEKKPWEYEISPEKEVAKEKKEGIPDEFVYTEERKKLEPSLHKPEYTGDKIDVALNFDNAEIKDVLQVILGEILNVNYILDKRVGGTINLHATGQVYKEELLSMLNALLYVYDFAIIKDGDLYKALPKAESRQETNIVVSGDKIPPWSKDIMVQIVPLQFENPKNLNATLRPFMTSVGNIVTHDDSRYIILIETASNMEKLLTLVKTFDVPFFAGKAVKFYDFKYVDARNMAKDLTVLAQSMGGEAGGKGEFSFVPFSDTNKMLIVARAPELLPKIDLWIKNIDVPPSESEKELKIYVYKVQHQKAETIVPVLTQIYSEKIAVQPKSMEKKQIEAMKIVADAKTNTIVVKALPGDYRSIKAIIEAIDATPPQVFIEALILEVTLGSLLDYGVQWTQNSGTSSTHMGSFVLSGFSDAGGFIQKRFARNNFEILMEILATNSNAKILSAPHILVRDEQSANIQVGQEVPVNTSSGQAAGTTAIFQQVQYRDTGIILTVTPHIGENDFVTLEIKQEVSNVFSDKGVGGNPVFSTRKAGTSLVVKSGHTISLGGIIQQNDNKTINKIPLLGDIPILGNLFKSTKITNDRTELIMLITPYIANDAEEADVLTNAFQKKLKGIEPLITQRVTEVEKH